MIEHVKKNISFIIIFITVVVSIQLTLDDLIDKEKYISPSVPKFKLPIEISDFDDPLTVQFPPIVVDVLLGGQKPVATKLPPPKPSKRRPTLRPLVLKAIMIEGKERIANINGSMLKVGGYINGRTVLKIEENGVLVTGPKGKRLIKIKD